LEKTMSATTDSHAITKLELLRRQQWNVVFGLFWGTLALLLLAIWTQSRYWEESSLIGWGVWLLFGVALAAAAVSVLQLRMMAKDKPEDQEKRLLQQRTRGPLLILALSVALLLLMLVLLFQAPLNLGGKLGALPVALSGVLLALIGGLAGVLLLVVPERKISQQQILEGLVHNRRGFMMVCLVVGGALFLLGLVLFFANREQWSSVFPQAAGALLLGLVFLGVGLWEMMASKRELTVANMRFLVLLLGGVAGLIIAVMTAIRAWMWRDVVLATGIRTWQGDQAWQLWLCIWLELLGLGLMFGSLYLAQADIRFNVALRRLLYGYNAIFTGLLVLAGLVIVNIVVYASFPYTANWTATSGFYSLSDTSKNTLAQLKKPTTVWILMSTQTQGYIDVKNLLENCQAYAAALDVREVSPERDPKEFQALQKSFPKLEEASKGVGKSGRGLLIAYNYSANSPPPAKGENIEHAFIPASELFKQDPMRKAIEFRGEGLLMTQLKFLIGGGAKTVVYFTQSNGESDIKSMADENKLDASGQFKEKLESANFEVRSLYFDAPDSKKGDEAASFTKTKATDAFHKIPMDPTGKSVVMIVWPQKTFTKEQLESLEEYMNKGGKLCVMSSNIDRNLGPLKKSIGLEELLKKYGVEMGEDFILQVDIPGRGPKAALYSATQALVEANQNSNNLIAIKFKNARFAFESARTVKKAAVGGGQYRADVIFEVPIESDVPTWADSDLKHLADPVLYVYKLYQSGELKTKGSKTALPVAVAVTDPSDQPRLVVYGDGTLTSNSMARRQNVFDLGVSTVGWLGGRPLEVGIPPKTTNVYTFPDKQNVSTARMVLLPFGLMILGLAGVGLGIWVVRRP
jgi:hypothetical protein